MSKDKINEYDKKKFYFDQRKSKRIINTNNSQIVELREEINEGELGDVIKACVVDYSLGGCGLALLTKHSPKPQKVYQFNSEKLAPQFKLIRGQVIWCKLLENKTFRIGIQYTDILK